MRKKLAFLKGFTLLEVLLVIAIIAINPSKQLADSRNAQRRSDVNTILNAVYQYAIDTGSMPATITETETEICKTGATDCTGLVDLSVLTANGKYLVAIPEDPTGASTNGTGYTILKTANGRITVNAPHAEQGVVISATR